MDWHTWGLVGVMAVSSDPEEAIFLREICQTIADPAGVMT